MAGFALTLAARHELTQAIRNAILAGAAEGAEAAARRIAAAVLTKRPEAAQAAPMAGAS